MSNNTKLFWLGIILFVALIIAYLLKAPIQQAREAREKSDSLLNEFKRVDNSIKKLNDSIYIRNDSLEKLQDEK